MKKSILIKITLALCTIPFLSSCVGNMFNSISGNNKVTIENRKITEQFDHITISNGLEVYLTQDSKTSIVVEADENLQEIIKTEISNGELKIYSKKNIWSSKAQKVFISTTTLKEVTATSGSELYTEESINFPDLELNATSGATVNVTTYSDKITSSATSGADLHLKGNSNYS